MILVKHRCFDLIMHAYSNIDTEFGFNNEALFLGLPEHVCSILKSNMSSIQYKAGDYIFKEYDQPLGIYRVSSGKVKKLTTTDFGTEHIFYICKQKEFLGYHAVISQEKYADSAVALVDSSIDFIPIKDFQRAMEASNELIQRLLKTLSHEFRVYINATKILAKYTVRERTALNLLILECKFRSGTQDQTEIIITRDNLANMVGTAKESLVRTLKEFKDDNLISTNRSSIFIKDYKKLLKVSCFNKPQVDKYQYKI